MRPTCPPFACRNRHPRCGCGVGLDTAAGRWAQALAGKDGAWLVAWQDEVVDPVGVTPYLLDRAGAEVKSRPSFWQLGLRHWQLDPERDLFPRPQPDHVAAAQLRPQARPAGLGRPGRRRVDGLLAGAQHPARGLPGVADPRGCGGQSSIGRWDGRPAGYDYPTTRWPVGEPLFGRYPIPAPPFLPGQRYATLAIYSSDEPDGLDLRDAADNPAGKRVRIGPF